MDFKILSCFRFSATPGNDAATITRTVKDYEIDLEMADGRRYYNPKHGEAILRKGDVLFRIPGETYDFSRISTNSYMLTLDFSGRDVINDYHRNAPGPVQSISQNPLLENLEYIIHFNDYGSIASIYEKLFSLSDRNSPAALCLVQELLHRLNAQVFHRKYKELKPEESACDIVMAHMRQNPSQQITLDALSDLVHLDKSYLTRIFKKKFGKSPIDTLIDIRMSKALDLVANTNISVFEMARLCGYNTPSFFSSEYKKKYKISPIAHRKTFRPD